MPNNDMVPYFGTSEIADQPTLPQGGACLVDYSDPPQPPMPEVDVVVEFATRATAGRDLKEAIDAATAWNEGAGLYDGFVDKVGGALNAAYPTFLCLLSNDGSAMPDIMKRLGRKRQPKKGTEAVLALSLAAKPQDNAQQKTCSEYAKVLVWAAENAVEVENFLDRFAATDLKTCTSFVRKLRKQKKEGVAPAEADGDGAKLGEEMPPPVAHPLALPAAGKPYVRIEVVGEDGQKRVFQWAQSPKLVKRLLALPAHHFTIFGPVLRELNEAARDAGNPTSTAVIKGS